ncbi:hypothetical protein H6F97_24860 [Microcoleus sp. FACHB-1]|nr:hypothetical protein [Microcoleus sp. FACHB-1]
MQESGTVLQLVHFSNRRKWWRSRSAGAKQIALLLRLEPEHRQALNEKLDKKEGDVIFRSPTVRL